MWVGGRDVRFRHDTKNSRTTTCIVSDEDGVRVGMAVCSEQDNFDRKVGRKMALKKAIQGLPKSERTRIWTDYKEVARV